MVSRITIVAVVLSAACIATACGRTAQSGGSRDGGDTMGATAAGEGGTRGAGTGSSRPPEPGTASGGDRPALAGAGGAGSGGGAGAAGGGACDSTGWCCDPNGLCCNDDLGLCEGVPFPGGGLPGGGFPGDGFAGGAAPRPPVPGLPPTGWPGTNGPGPELMACEQDGTSAGPGYCDRQYTCENGLLFTYCHNEGDGWYCNCDRERYHAGFRLRGISNTNACDAIADVCMAGELPGGEVNCERRHMEQGGEFCAMDQECTRSFEAGGGQGDLLEYRSTYCQAHGGTWMCECNGSNHAARIELLGNQSSPGICEEVSDLCSAGAVTASGPATCTQRFQSADRTYCDAELECAQAGTLGDQDVRVFTQRRASCFRDGDGDGDWKCECTGQDTYFGFNLQGDDGWDICSDAGEVCAAGQ